MKTIAKATLGLSTAALFATSAFAGQVKSDDTAKTTAPSQTVKTIDSDNQVSQLTLVQMNENGQAVLGAFEQQTTDAYIVQNNTGDLFINHLVLIEDLPDPVLNVETIETFETTYRGMTFTNKVVGEAVAEAQ
jgi:hypothetical protein